MTLEGIDVSRWQPTTPSLVGLSFLFARATYGTFADGKYPTHIANGRKAGLLVGAYHFGRNGDVAGQVKAFLGQAGRVDFYALDLENDGTNSRMTDNEAREFISRVRGTGRRCGLYHSRSGFPTGLGQSYNWVASWTISVPSIPWTFWQYQGSPLDRDKFGGSLAELRQLAGLSVDVRYEVHVHGPLRLYSTVAGKLIGAVTKATYVCRRRKVNGLWWYQIVLGKRTGQAFKPNRNVSAVVL